MMIYVYIWYDDICRYMIWLWHIYENQLKWYIIHWLLSMVIFGIQLLEDWEVCRSIHGPRKSVLLRAWSPHREMARRKWHTTGGTSDESCLMQNSWQIGFEPADVLITNDFRWKAWNKKLGLYRCLQLRSPSSRQWHNLATGLFVWYARIAPPQSKQAWMGFKMFQDVLRCFKLSLRFKHQFCLWGSDSCSDPGSASFVPLWAYCLRGTVIALSGAVWKYLKRCCHDLSEGMHPWYLPFRNAYSEHEVTRWASKRIHDPRVCLPFLGGTIVVWDVGPHSHLIYSLQAEQVLGAAIFIALRGLQS